MASYTLTAASPAAGLHVQHSQIEITEVCDRAVVSLAVPNGRQTQLAERIESVFGVALPQTGKSTQCQRDNARLLGLARDQFFVAFDHGPDDPEAHIKELVGDSGYVVDQSDSWVMLSVQGAHSRAMLERICPLNLNPAAFAVGDVARTVMEHHAAIVLREGDDRYLLMSPRSSAKSFAHAVTVSADSVS